MKLAAGQVAVVTGGASGIGLALAEQLGARGLSVVVADVRDDVLQAAERALAAAGIEVLACRTDVRDAASVDRLAERALARFGRVDLVCNNAGVVPPPLRSWEQPLSSWSWAVEVMLLGVVHGLRSFVPALVGQGTGHVLNTASVGGLVPLPFLAPYAATKAAVVALTETLAEELLEVAPGVGATVLCPGLVMTDLQQSSSDNRPEPLRRAVDHEPQAATPGPAMPAMAEGMPAAEVAAAALAGIESDALHVVVGAGAGQRARQRIDRLLADLG